MAPQTPDPGGSFTDNRVEVTCPWCLAQMQRENLRGENLAERLHQARAKHRRTLWEQENPYWDDLPF